MIKTLLSVSLILCLVSSLAWAKKNEDLDPPRLEKETQLLKKTWSHSLKTSSKKAYFPEAASPYVWENRLYVGTHSGVFYCLDLANKGKALWTFKSDGPIASQAISDGGQVFFGNNKGNFYSLDLRTGKLNWKKYLGAEILVQPALSGDNLYIVTTSREVYSLNKTNGYENWVSFIRGFERKFTMRGHSPVLYDNGNLYVAFADGQIVNLQASNGQVVWSQNLSTFQSTFKDVDSHLLIDEGALYAIGYYGTLAKLNRSNGSVIWRQEYSGGADITQDADTLYVSTDTSHVVAIRKDTGFRRWEVPLNSGTLSSPQQFLTYLLIGTETGKAYVLDQLTGSVLQSVNVGNGYGSNAYVDNGFVYVLSNSGTIQGFQLARK